MARLPYLLAVCTALGACVLAGCSTPGVPEADGPLRLVAPAASSPLARALQDRIRGGVLEVEGRRLVVQPELEAAYAGRGWAPLWQDDDASAHALLRTLQAVGDDGFDPTEYHADAIAALLSRDRSEAESLDLELLLSEAFLRYGNDLLGRRLDPNALQTDWHPHQRSADLPALLEEAAETGLPHHVSARLHPRHPGYWRLRAAYAAGREFPGESLQDQRRLALLRMNMERWRWLPDDLGEHHLMVNLPAFTMWVVSEGEEVLRQPVVIGREDGWRTPVFSDTLERIEFNPSWYIPASIQRESYGYVRPGRSQRPGPRNPLGRAKFLFPNRHNIYVHDTNATSLFGTERRAYSHGCIRASDPEGLALTLLERANGWTRADVDSVMTGPWRTHREELDEPVPVHLVYFTAWADEDGTVEWLDDVYEHDRALGRALGFGELFPEDPTTEGLAAADGTAREAF